MEPKISLGKRRNIYIQKPPIVGFHVCFLWCMSSYIFTRQKVFPKYFSQKELFAVAPVCCTASQGNSERNDCYLGPPSPPKKKSTACPDLEIRDMKRILKKKRQRRRERKAKTGNVSYLEPDWTLCFWGSKFHPPKKRSKFQSTQGSTCWFQVYTVGKNGKAANGW